MPTFNSEYPDNPIPTEIDAREPSYENVLKWMQAQPSGRQGCFDFWARGNYIRRLLFHRSKGIAPVQVCVWDVGQIRWAYRRLALLGLPIEFVYCGDECASGKTLGITRVAPDFMFDAGWGYIGTIWKDASETSWLMVIGRACLLPATVVDWIVDEASEDFLVGKVFVAPAEVIGVGTGNLMPSLSAWSDVNGGTAVVPYAPRTATEGMSLEIPFLDAISPGQLRTFLRDHEGDLTAFQRSFQRLVTGRQSLDSSVPAMDLVEEVRFQVAELTRSSKFARLRNEIAALGGTIGTVSAAVAIAARPEDPVRRVALACAGTAGLSLLNMWKQIVGTQEQMNAPPYFIHWKLGIAQPSGVKRINLAPFIEPPRLALNDVTEVHGADHWLCPPTPGFRVLVQEK